MKKPKKTAINYSQNPMDALLIKPSNPNPPNHDPPLKYTSSFLLPNGFNTSPEFQISGIEMITIEAVTYTSLRDILPVSPPPIMSPTANSSWHEIPIKNPLLKHAAWAYLQPMSTAMDDAGDKGCFGKLKGARCFGCGGGGCFGWLSDVVLAAVKEVFGERRGMQYDGDYDDDEEEEEEQDEKVD